MISYPSYNNVPSVLWCFLEIVARPILRDMNRSFDRLKIEMPVGSVRWVLRVREANGHDEVGVHSNT
jgi:hypothetical protein